MSDRDALDFVLIGPFKTGTTWMDAYLRTHPAVSLPLDVKETFFFSRDAVHARGLPWFESLFDGGKPSEEGGVGRDGKRSEGRRVRGEVGPSYFHSAAALERIHAIAPRCRIVCSLREPAARLHSFYLHLLQRGEVPAGMGFLETLEQRPFLLETARYGRQVARWQARFGRERVAVLRYEDLIDDPQRLADALCEGIGVAPVAIAETARRRVNETMMPTNPHVARLAYGIARRLRHGGLHRLVNFARDAGARRLVASRFDERPRLSEEEREAVRVLLQDDLAMLGELLERDFGWSVDERR